MRGCHHPSAGLRAQALIAGIGEDLCGGAVGQEFDQSQLAGVGDVRTASEPGLVRLQNSTRPSPSVTTMDSTAVLPLAPRVVDDLGQGPQPHPGADGAASLGEQGAHLADGAGDGGAVHVEPSGPHVEGGRVSEVHESGQEPVDRPVIVRSLVIAALDAFPHHTTVIDDQELDASPFQCMSS